MPKRPRLGAFLYTLREHAQPTINFIHHYTVTKKKRYPVE
jgi:hypothetical protein